MVDNKMITPPYRPVEDQRKLRIGFLSQFDPMDRKASSGTSYKMAEQIAKIGDIEWIPIELTKTGRNLCRIQIYANKFFKKKLMIKMTEFGSRHLYKPLHEAELKKYDIIVAFFCSDVLANIKAETPIIYFTDATFPAMLDYYPDFSNLWKFNRQQGINVESRAIQNATHTIFSSDWAKNSAIIDCGGLSEKTSVVEFGPNIDDKDIISNIRTYDPNGILKLLFLGVEWDRKGGAKAVEACRWLNAHGVRSELTIIGVPTLPQEIEDLPFVRNIGFLNKNNPKEYKKLTDIIGESHLLILPTKNECSAIAFAEACAYGLPIMTHDTGGISNYVENGYNGYRLPLSSSPEDFGKKILEIIESKQLEKLSENAITLYKQKLNYNVWREKVGQLINKHCSN